ncbi:NACHT, LRR and PYD domains-containing protein 12-like [Esox lucius]|uniref:NACHT, LRR and PYD domains-containing protein 12-like n=1 Tax=Esox lucius TaxID=8010 RepID=UPI00147732B5|nr:NACHT, LRR and PYD domains-containing protein 12-like [Esox lucius]
MPTSVTDRLMATLEELNNKEIKKFQWYLKQPDGLISHMGFNHIPNGKLQGAEREGTVDMMVQRYGCDNAKEISMEIFKKMNRKDLAERLMEKHNTNDCAKECQTEAIIKLKDRLKRTSEKISEGIAKQGSTKYLENIYTELYITEGESGEVNNEHEVRKIETTAKKQARPETAIKCNDIFKPTPGQDKPIRTVLTKGVAGIGKTVSVQKFILDWAKGKANQDVQFVFSLPFRELNLMKKKELSLIQLINNFSIETKDARISNYNKYKVVLIFDGLDECRLPLDFKNNKSCCDVTESTSVDVLLTNLIKGNLLPFALLWITTRPAAANQIPSECIDLVTEVRGFNDPQKEEYFRKRFSNEVMASRIISHIKTSRSLHIMCHIPVFCWITATVLEHMLTTDDKVELPKTLTDMYSHFLVFQSTHRNVKYDGKNEKDPHWRKESILTLGKLAFKQLQKGNLIFYEEDLKECGIDINEASVYSGVCTQIFKIECGLNQDKVFCFVHLSIQEFLAAVYVFHSIINNNKNLMDEKSIMRKMSMLFRINSEVPFYKTAVDKALQSETGHLDLFLRFLLGLSLESNQKHLRGLLTKTRSSSQSHEETVKYIKEKIRENPSSERCINLFHCLNELNDHSLVEEIQRYLSSGSLSREELSPAQWSALTFVLLTSEEEIDVFDLKKYSPSQKGLLGLLPVIKTCRTALLAGCGITEEGCLRCLPPPPIQFRGLPQSPLLSRGLPQSPLQSCGLSQSLLQQVPPCPPPLAPGPRPALPVPEPPPATLAPEPQPAILAPEAPPAIPAPDSRLQTPDPQLAPDPPPDTDPAPDPPPALPAPDQPPDTDPPSALPAPDPPPALPAGSLGSLVSALKSNPSHLKELDLSNNDLKDTGVEQLYALLKDPQCRLETLRLSGCMITEEGFVSLVSALTSNPSHLKELDLSYNHPGHSGVRLLSAGLECPYWRLEKLNLEHGGKCRLKSGLKKYACELTLDPNTPLWKLSLSEQNRKVTHGREGTYPDHPERFENQGQVLCRESLSGRCYFEVERTGGEAAIGLTYKGISRKGGSYDSTLGRYNKSWCLYSVGDRYSARHNNKETDIPVPSSDPHRVGVYLDWPAGTLSFYSVSSDTLTHLYTFNTTFTEPLYPGFRLYEHSMVSLCQ